MQRGRRFVVRVRLGGGLGRRGEGGSSGRNRGCTRGTSAIIASFSSVSCVDAVLVLTVQPPVPSHQLFTYHQTRPFPSTTAFTDLPLPTFTPIPNTTPLNLPPLPHSSATSPNPASAPAPARGPIERHLIIFTDDGKVVEEEEVRWNNEARFDGVKWANVAEETGRMDIKTSLIVLDQAGELEGVDGRLTGLVAGTVSPPLPSTPIDKMVGAD